MTTDELLTPAASEALLSILETTEVRDLGPDMEDALREIESHGYIHRDEAVSLTALGAEIKSSHDLPLSPLASKVLRSICSRHPIHEFCDDAQHALRELECKGFIRRYDIVSLTQSGTDAKRRETARRFQAKRSEIARRSLDPGSTSAWVRTSDGLSPAASSALRSLNPRDSTHVLELDEAERTGLQELEKRSFISCTGSFVTLTDAGREAQRFAIRLACNVLDSRLRVECPWCNAILSPGHTGLPGVLRLWEYGQQTCPACKGEYFIAELHLLRASFEEPLRERLREAAKERGTACVVWSVVTAIATAIVCSLLSA